MSHDLDTRSEAEKERDRFAASSLFAMAMADCDPGRRWQWEQQAKKDGRKAMLLGAKLIGKVGGGNAGPGRG